jgi:hypothetical protein
LRQHADRVCSTHYHIRQGEDFRAHDELHDFSAIRCCRQETYTERDEKVFVLATSYMISVRFVAQTRNLHRARHSDSLLQTRTIQGCVLRQQLARLCSQAARKAVFSGSSQGCVLRQLARLCSQAARKAVFSGSSQGCVLRQLARLCAQAARKAVFSGSWASEPVASHGIDERSTRCTTTHEAWVGIEWHSGSWCPPGYPALEDATSVLLLLSLISV